MKSSIVIGANYGDEGKGLMTDYLCKKHNADVVVRFNGGAQAGHTVVTPEGDRHVFSHIGSGYFLGVPTYLSEYFILNPIMFRKEYDKLKIPADYKIYISYKSLITTYWDMLGNRVMEEMRGSSAHGSCGVGINATIERAEAMLNSPFNQTFIGYSNDDDSIIQARLTCIKDYWYYQLLLYCIKWKKELPDWARDCFIRGNEINKQFVDDLRFMLARVDVDFNFDKVGYAVFEGAQGLALDQFYGNDPYVTRSNTGMRNVLDMQWKERMEFSIDEIVYVSRTYETRHGNDPNFIDADDNFKHKGELDKTNVKNEWQGELRYRWLNYDRLYSRINLDVNSNNIRQYGLRDNLRLALTHADQIEVAPTEERLLNGFKWHYTSFGETRNDVKEH